MKVLVFIKQIPDVNMIKFDEKTKRIIREGVPLSMNSFDKKGVEEALRLKEKYGVETVVASMGPPQASQILNEALRMGIDRAALISDRKFGGSDTLATSKILSEFAKIEKPDLIFTGKYSLDGETSQVPPEIAVFLGYQFLSSVSKIEAMDEHSIIVERDLERGSSRARITIPALLSVSEKINKARAIKPGTPDMSSKVEIFDSARIGIDISGQEFSPTVVQGTQLMENRREATMIDYGTNLFDEVTKIIESNSKSDGDPEEIEIKGYEDGRDSILTVAIDDIQISEEISSKCAELAAKNSLNAIIFGNIEPTKVSTMIGNKYYYVKAKNIDEVTASLYNFISETKPKYVIFPSTIDGRDAAASIAAKMSLGLTADCVDLDIEDEKLIQYKPAFGGNVVASIYSKTDPQMATVRPGMFKKRISRSNPEIIEWPSDYRSQIEIIEETPVPSEFAPLNSKKVVVGFGRGVKNKNFVQEIVKLAEKLDASVGASRPVVDMKFVPRQQQIGLTGTSISPSVYLNLGISGQPNHVVGIRYSKIIISVNSDPNAEIFKYSDYGIVADLTEFVNGFNAYLDSKKKSS
jgi:electron transfer flavoprotein alpha subunit